MEPQTPTTAQAPVEPNAPTPAAPTPSPTPLVEKVPSVWQGAFALLKNSKAVIRVNLWTVVPLALLNIAASGVGNAKNENPSSVYLVLLLISIIASVILSVALALALLASIDNKKMSIGEALSKSFGYCVNYFLLTVVMIVLLTVSLLALIVPFFFVLPRVLLAEYYLIDKNMGPIESLKASWNDSKGHVGKVYGIIGVNILFVLIMLTIIGIPIAIYFILMYSAALPILYRWILRNQAAAGPVTQQGPVNPAASGPVVQ